VVSHPFRKGARKELGTPELAERASPGLKPALIMLALCGG
jgi:hypothetical protein